MDSDEEDLFREPEDELPQPLKAKEGDESEEELEE